MKSNDDKASPCFKPLLTGNMSDKRLNTRTLLQVSFKHIFIILTSSKGIPNSRVLYKTSLLTESQVFSKSTNSWWIASSYSHFFSSIWRMQGIWSVVDLLSQRPQWWTPDNFPRTPDNFPEEIIRVWIKSCMQLTKVIRFYNYYHLFYHPSYK